jgi:intein/homing endonuclease
MSASTKSSIGIKKDQEKNTKDVKEGDSIAISKDQYNFLLEEINRLKKNRNSKDREEKHIYGFYVIRDTLTSKMVEMIIIDEKDDTTGVVVSINKDKFIEFCNDVVNMKEGGTISLPEYKVKDRMGFLQENGKWMIGEEEEE